MELTTRLARAKYLVLQVLRPSFIDRSPLLQKYLKGYRLDFGEANVLRTTEEEVVLSFKRIESVFGSIRAPPSANGRKEPRFGEGLMMFYRRLTGSLSREKKA